MEQCWNHCIPGNSRSQTEWRNNFGIPSLDTRMERIGKELKISNLQSRLGKSSERRIDRSARSWQWCLVQEYQNQEALILTDSTTNKIVKAGSPKGAGFFMSVEGSTIIITTLNCRSPTCQFPLFSIVKTHGYPQHHNVFNCWRVSVRWPGQLLRLPPSNV